MQITLQTSLDNTLQVGNDANGSVESSAEYTSENQPVGFHGVQGTSFWQQIGAITVASGCYKGKVETDEVPPAPASLSTEMLIVAIVVPVAVVLIIVGVVVAVVVARKRQLEKENTGSEIISVKKTRP